MLKSSIKLKQLYHQSKEHVDLKEFNYKILKISNNLKMDSVWALNGKVNFAKKKSTKMFLFSSNFYWKNILYNTKIR